MKLSDVETIRIDGIDHSLKILPVELCADMGFVGKVVAVIAFMAVRYEVWQENQSPLSTCDYVRAKWLDRIVDVLAAVVSCALVLWGFGAL